MFVSKEFTKRIDTVFGARKLAPGQWVIVFGDSPATPTGSDGSFTLAAEAAYVADNHRAEYAISVNFHTESSDSVEDVRERLLYALSTHLAKASGLE
jgi:hypothetical protein